MGVVQNVHRKNNHVNFAEPDYDFVYFIWQGPMNEISHEVVVIAWCQVEYGRYFLSFYIYFEIKCNNLRNEENMPYCASTSSINSLPHSYQSIGDYRSGESLFSQG